MWFSLVWAMSKTLKKRKNHWTSKVQESVLGRNEEGELRLELKGGAENGQFPVIGELLPGRAACNGGKLCQDDLLLEVNDTPVAGLTTRDVHAVARHSKDPLRLKCVKQGEPLALAATLRTSRFVLLSSFGHFWKPLSSQRSSAVTAALLFPKLSPRFQGNVVEKRNFCGACL